MNQLKLHKKKFDELSPSELYEIIKVRLDVFVVEQVCPYLDLDDVDQHAVHIWYSQANLVKAYVRVVPPGPIDTEYCSIGRVVTSSDMRREGLGKRVFELGIACCKERYPHVPIKISAQLYLKRFYESMGFAMHDKIYLEDGIPHISMIYQARVSNVVTIT